MSYLSKRTITTYVEFVYYRRLWTFYVKITELEVSLRNENIQSPFSNSYSTFAWYKLWNMLGAELFWSHIDDQTRHFSPKSAGSSGYLQDYNHGYAMAGLFCVCVCFYILIWNFACVQFYYWNKTFCKMKFLTSKISWNECITSKLLEELLK